MQHPRVHISALLGSLLLGAGVFGGCMSARPKTTVVHPLADSLGVFVDACHTLIDSIKVEEGAIRVYEPNQEAVHEFFARGVGKGGDTAFYIRGAIAFLRIPDPEGRHRYFFGYNHRGGREDWKGAMWVEVVPKRLMTPGTTFTKVQVFNYLPCQPEEPATAADSSPDAPPSSADLSALEPDSTARLSDYNWDDVTLMDVANILRRNDSRVDDLEISVNDLPEYSRDDHDLESGKGFVRVRDLESIQISSFWDLPVTEKQLKLLKLSKAQALNAGARLKPRPRP